MRKILAITLVLSGFCFAELSPLPSRQPKYPPKTARSLHTDDDVARARKNIEKYPAARKVAEQIIKVADQWVAWKDEDLVFLLTHPDVPRAFAVSTAGCPECGHKINEVGGDYAWIIDPKVPFKVKCPVDGSVWPTNDYETYYRSGFTEKKGWDTSHVDDGRGWKDPRTGEKSWFVAYFNHWMWHKHLVPGVNYLAQAYLLTGDERYARKAGVMLKRIAEVYPGMDHEKQSRYGELMAARGGIYRGKVVNLIWETGLALAVTQAYDAVWETLSQDDRNFIEANFLEDAIDAYFAGKIRGNFGMHQNTLVHLAQVRQTGETTKWLDGLMNEASTNAHLLGLNYALYNQIYRDGLPSETAPGYNFLWVSKIADYGDRLQRAGMDVFGIPRTRRLFEGVLDQINIGRFTPALGDSGSVYGGLTGNDRETFQAAWRYYKDPRFAAFLQQMKATGEASFATFDSLFRDPVDAADSKLPPAKTRLLDGYGMAILNNPTDDVSLSLYYGQKHGHGHFDRLHFELFANGQPIMPDLGYPDAMNEFVPGIYTWSKNTIAHNTVVVDARRQPDNVPGEVKLFADSPFARVVDIEASGTYPQCSTYRRAMIMVDAAPGQSYFVDIFNVAGGNQHDYSLHGPPGDFEMIGGKWSEPAKGTLAGEDVEVGQIYDDPKLSAKGYAGGYGGYTGSGFQHLFNVRTQQEAGWVAQWKHEKDPGAMLRIRVLDQPGQGVMLCDARVSPVKYPQIVRYLVARKQGEAVRSRFVSILEPFREKPFIKEVRPVAAERADGAVVVEVVRESGEVDRIRRDDSGRVSVQTLSGAGKALRSFEAGAPESIGEVIAVEPAEERVRIKGKGSALQSPQDLVGRIVHFRNNRHRTAHPVRAAERQADGSVLLTLADDIRVGLAKVGGVAEAEIATSTALPLDVTYRGATLSDEQARFQHPVKSVGGGKIVLDRPLPKEHPIVSGGVVWLLDVGVGDAVELAGIDSHVAK